MLDSRRMYLLPYHATMLRNGDHGQGGSRSIRNTVYIQRLYGAKGGPLHGLQVKRLHCISSPFWRMRLFVVGAVVLFCLFPTSLWHILRCHDFERPIDFMFICVCTPEHVLAVIPHSGRVFARLRGCRDGVAE